MSANVINTKFAGSLARGTAKRTSGRSKWPVVAAAGLGGSVLFFMVGLLVSAATWLGLIASSRFLASVDVAILLVGFLLAFLGAHAMDRRDELRRENERRVSYVRNSPVVDMTAARIRFSGRK